MKAHARRAGGHDTGFIRFARGPFGVALPKECGKYQHDGDQDDHGDDIDTQRPYDGEESVKAPIEHPNKQNENDNRTVNSA